MRLRSIFGWCWILGWLQAWVGVSGLRGDDPWPQWRGGALDSRSSAQGLPADFGPDQGMLWKAALPGPAGSTPVVWDDRVYLTTANQDHLELLAFDRDGKQIWSARLGGENRNLRMDSANFAAPSPATDGKMVWATSSAGVLHCFQIDGTPAWALDLQEKYGAFDIQFGMASTPILDQGRLYLQLIHGNMRDQGPGVGIVLCLDAKTGKEIWKVNRETEAVFENKHSYASPTIYRHDSTEFLVTHGGDVTIAHDLQDGSEIWRVGGLNPKNNYNNFLRFVSSPAVGPGMIVIPSAKGGPVLCLRPNGKGDLTEQASAFWWKLDRGTPDVASPVVHDGLIYLCLETGALVCLDAKNGEEIYKERILSDRHRSTPVIADGKLFITGRDGSVLVVQTGRDLNVLAKNSLGETITASPAISNGRIYIRTWESLYCFGN